MSILAASFRKFQSKLSKLLWWQSISEALQQSRECKSKINDPAWPDFKLVRDFIHVHLICKFQEYPIKLKELWWWQTFSHRKSMEPCGFHSNQGFHCIFTKSSDEKWLRSACRLWRYIWSKVMTDDGRRTDVRMTEDHYPINSPETFGPGEIQLLKRTKKWHLLSVKNVWPVSHYTTMWQIWQPYLRSFFKIIRWSYQQIQEWNTIISFIKILKLCWLNYYIMLHKVYLCVTKFIYVPQN